MPLLLYATVADLPTATNTCPFHATLVTSAEIGLDTAVQLDPLFRLYAITPLDPESDPTPTHIPPFHATSLHLLNTALVKLAQVMPSALRNTFADGSAEPINQYLPFHPNP
jgi:hypothetical protein